MVTCSKCGKDNQPEATYCDNCGVPVQLAQGEPLSSRYKSRVGFMVGIMAGILLVGVGIVLGLYAESFGMSGSEVFGYALIVGGIAVLIVSVLLFLRT